MSKLKDKPTRKEVLRFISKSASYGNLGLFIGSGFSKAVLNDEFDQIALSWKELLQKASEELEIKYDSISQEGISFPEIASQISSLYSERNNESFKDALNILKQVIARLTSWYPEYQKREEFSQYLNSLSPSWIITTNYDLVIEALLTGRSITLGPRDVLISSSNVVPIFHLHGSRTKPEELILAQEDYIALFRPNEYRQIKLALTLKESTTLFLGYGLGDVNVLTALDWSENVFKSNETEYPNEFIQILREENPKKKPYRDKNGILIIETDELSQFFNECLEIRGKEIKKESKEKDKLDKILEVLLDPDKDTINIFIDDAAYRRGLIKELSDFPLHMMSGFISFIEECINETWVRSEKAGNFKAYDENLNIILDILTGFKADKIPPALFQTAAYSLERVSGYVGTSYLGESWSAGRSWNRRKDDLNKEIIEELTNIAEQHSYRTLSRLLKK